MTIERRRRRIINYDCMPTVHLILDNGEFVDFFLQKQSCFVNVKQLSELSWIKRLCGSMVALELKIFAAVIVDSNQTFR
jgi:hypothetical protein